MNNIITTIIDGRCVRLGSTSLWMRQVGGPPPGRRRMNDEPDHGLDRIGGKVGGLASVAHVVPAPMATARGEAEMR